MTERRRIKSEKAEEIEEGGRPKKRVQPVYDQAKARDEGATLKPGPSIGEHAAILRSIRSDEQRAKMMADLQQSYGNAYVQQVVERVQAEKGFGQPLESQARGEMEAAFRQDFKNVRVHSDAEADQLARELGAEAFTTGRDIFFREGAYQPGSEKGKRLLGHELTHVVQQGGVEGQVPKLVSDPQAHLEKEADAVARQVLSSAQQKEGYGVSQVEHANAAVIARKPEAPAYAAEEELVSDINNGLKEAQKHLGQAKKVLDLGQKLTKSDFGGAISALNKVSGGLGQVASAVGRAKSVLHVANTIDSMSRVWDEYMSSPTTDNLQRLQKELDSTLKVFQDSSGVLEGLVPGIGRYISQLLGAGRGLIGAFMKALALKLKKTDIAAFKGGEEPKLRAAPEPEMSEKEAQTAEAINKHFATKRELEDEGKKLVKPREVEAHIERQLKLFLTIREQSMPAPVDREFKDFKIFYSRVLDSLNKLEGLTIVGKLLTDKEKVYKDKFLWAIDLSLAALKKLSDEVAKIDIGGPWFTNDRVALQELRSKYPK